MKEQFKEYWQGRSARDRRIIVMFAAFITLSLLYAYIWMPINDARTRLRVELPKLRGAAAEMAMQAEEVARLKSVPTQTTSGNSQQLINQSAEQAGIAGDISQITPLSNERIQVSLNNVAFDKWIRWNQGLATTSGLRIESVQVSAAGEPGMVKAQVVFALPAQ